MQLGQNTKCFSSCLTKFFKCYINRINKINYLVTEGWPWCQFVDLFRCGVRIQDGVLVLLWVWLSSHCQLEWHPWLFNRNLSKQFKHPFLLHYKKNLWYTLYMYYKNWFWWPLVCIKKTKGLQPQWCQFFHWFWSRSRQGIMVLHLHHRGL